MDISGTVGYPSDSLASC